MRKSIALTLMLTFAAGAALAQDYPPPEEGPPEMEEGYGPAETEEGYEERRSRHRDMMRDHERREFRRPGRRHHERPRPPHAGDGAGFVVNMGGGKRLRVNCGNVPIGGCVAGLEPVLRLLGAETPPPTGGPNGPAPGGMTTPQPMGQDAPPPPPPPVSPMPDAPATPPAQSN